VSLGEVIADYEAEGFVGQFIPADCDGNVRCLTCNRTTHADDVIAHHLRRVEGASDPADMAAVAALECPHCHTRGTITLKYGPDPTPEEAAILPLLEKHERLTP